MVNPPKKLKYGLWNPRGQQGRMLLCLLMGTLNGKSIIKTLECDGAGWVYKLLKELLASGYVEKNDVVFNDSLNRTNRKAVYKLTLKYFCDYVIQECNGLKFSNKEKLWMNFQLNNDRENIVIYCFDDCRGSIIKGILNSFSDTLITNTFMPKNRFYQELLLKLLVVMMSQSYSPRLHSRTESLNSIAYDYFSDVKILRFLKKYVNNQSGGIDLDNKEDKEFLNRLETLARLEKDI